MAAAGRALLLALPIMVLCCCQSAYGTSPAAPKPKGKAPPHFFNASKLYPFLGNVSKLTRESDVDAKGPCADSIRKFCGDVTPGDGKVAKCLANKVAALKEQKEASPLTPRCGAALHRFQLAAFVRAKPKDPSSLFAVEPVEGLRDACKEDAGKFCPGKVGLNLTRCLKMHFVKEPKTGSVACKERLFKVRMKQAKDMEFDPFFYSACAKDLKTGSCASVANTTVQRKACLRKHRKELSLACRGALFNNTMASAEDIRLNQDVFTTCKADVTKFCKDQDFGEARMLMCLWDSQAKDGFSYDCRKKVNALTARSVEDYRLDFRVRTRCEKEIDSKCKKQKDLVDNLTVSELFGGKDEFDTYYDGQSGKVLQCLKQQYGDMPKGACKEEVSRVIRVQALHAGADPILQRKCRNEIPEFCAEVPPTSVHLCLRKHMKDLSADCRGAEALQGSLEAGSISLKPQLKAACTRAINKFCKDVNPGAAQVIRCLQDNMDEDEFPSVCKEAVMEDLEASNHDWRLKYGISHECQTDAKKLCNEEMDLAGGEVIKCLKKNFQKLATQACKAEMRRFIGQGLKNIKLAPTQMQACTEDVKEFCHEVPFGSGRVHDCLLTHRYEITLECAAEEFKSQKFRSEDIRMAPKAMSVCRGAMKKYCDGTNYAGGRMWRCLEDKSDEDDFPKDCSRLVTRHMALKNSEIDLNPQLAKNCRADADKLCQTESTIASTQDFASEGEVIACLIRMRAEIKNTTCKEGILRMQKQRIEHASFDPYKNDVCKPDMERFCKDSIGKGNGLVYACLKKHLKELDVPCREAQEEQMEQVSEDARLSPQLLKVCKATKTRFCKDVDAGGHRLWSCLMAHMHEGGVEPACRTALVAEERKEAKDFRFTPAMRKTCGATLQKFSANHTCKDVTNTDGNWQVSCLTKHVNIIGDNHCAFLVRQMLQRQSADLRARPGMENACSEDIAKLCEGVAAGANRWHQCLQGKVAKIKNAECKDMVLAFKAATHNSFLNYDINRNCKNEVEAFCKDVPATTGKRLDCLKLHEKTTGFGAQCRTALIKANATSVIAASAKEAKARDRSTMEDLQAWLEKHQSVTDKYGGVMLGGAVAVTALLAFSISYCVLKKKYNRQMYGPTPDVGEPA